MRHIQIYLEANGFPQAEHVGGSAVSLIDIITLAYKMITHLNADRLVGVFILGL